MGLQNYEVVLRKICTINGFLDINEKLVSVGPIVHVRHILYLLSRSCTQPADMTCTEINKYEPPIPYNYQS